MLTVYDIPAYIYIYIYMLLDKTYHEALFEKHKSIKNI